MLFNLNGISYKKNNDPTHPANKVNKPTQAFIKENHEAPLMINAWDPHKNTC